MPEQEREAQLVERLQRGRSRVLLATSLLFLLWQGLFLSERWGGNSVSAEVSKTASFVVWAVLVLVVLVTGGGLVKRGGASVRAAMNDELTQANRRAALMFGYWWVLGAAAVFYALALFVEIRLEDAAHVILTLGVAAPSIAFAVLERRSESRDA